MLGQTLDTAAAQRTDAELIDAIARHDDTALAALYDRYHLLAFSIALKVVNDRARAEDVVQDAFLAVWRRAGTYAEGRGSVRTWLACIVRNRAIDIVRGRREATADEIIALCKEKLGSVKAPKSVDFWERLPRSPVGKVLKRDIRKPFWEGRGRQI